MCESLLLLEKGKGPLLQLLTPKLPKKNRSNSARKCVAQIGYACLGDESYLAGENVSQGASEGMIVAEYVYA